MSQQEPSPENSPATPGPSATAGGGEGKSTRLQAVHSSNRKGVRFKAKVRAEGAEELKAKPQEKVEEPVVPPQPEWPKVEMASPRKPWKFKVSPLAAAVGMAGGFVFLTIFGLGFGAGQWWLQRKMAKQQEARVIEFSKVAQGRLNDAMKDLREGDARKALDAFQAMGREFPHVPSLNYLSAVAAMQAGEVDIAQALVEKSLRAKERESDAFALLAIMETQRALSRSKISSGDPALQSEKLLWRAVLADPANPLPFIELATLMRYKGKHEDAKKALEAAHARLQPMDSHVVVDVTLALVRLEAMPTDQLEAGDTKSDNINTLMPAAYVALRKDNFSEAAAMLKRCRGLISMDLYDYLINDPAFRKFSYRAEMKTAFQP